MSHPHVSRTPCVTPPAPRPLNTVKWSIIQDNGDPSWREVTGLLRTIPGSLWSNRQAFVLMINGWASLPLPMPDAQFDVPSLGTVNAANLRSLASSWEAKRSDVAIRAELLHDRGQLNDAQLTYIRECLKTVGRTIETVLNPLANALGRTSSAVDLRA